VVAKGRARLPPDRQQALNFRKAERERERWHMMRRDEINYIYIYLLCWRERELCGCVCVGTYCTQTHTHVLSFIYFRPPVACRYVFGFCSKLCAHTHIHTHINTLTYSLTDPRNTRERYAPPFSSSSLHPPSSAFGAAVIVICCCRCCCRIDVVDGQLREWLCARFGRSLPECRVRRRGFVRFANNTSCITCLGHMYI